MSLTLHTYPGNPRAFKALIAAQYAKVQINVPEFKMGVDNKTTDFLRDVNPLGKVPALSTPEGSIFESNAIARYVARLAPSSDLYGKTPLEAGQIDQWIDFASNEIDLPASAWIYPILGAIPENKALTEKAKEDISKVLSVLDKHLLTKTFLVGERVSLADIVVACTLYLPFVLVFDPKFRAPFGNVVRWYETLVHQPEFSAVMSNPTLCQTQRFAGDGLGYAASAAAPAAKKEEKKKEEKKKEEAPAAAKKEEKKKEEKKEEKKKEEAPAAAKKEEAPKKKAAAAEDDDEEDDVPKEPKAKNPLDLLPPSSFVLDDFKRLYSNTKDIKSIFAEFWSKFDNEGWSWYLSEYKFNEELSKLYMVNNLVGGFLQRLDNLRKYGFGNLLIFGQEPNMKVAGCWLMRGQEIPPAMHECDDSAWYTWTKLDPVNNPAHKELVQDYMLWVGKFGGKESIEATDGKTFK